MWKNNSLVKVDAELPAAREQEIHNLAEAGIVPEGVAMLSLGYVLRIHVLPHKK